MGIGIGIGDIHTPLLQLALPCLAYLLGTAGLYGVK
jgi:hypothetical protein